MRPVLSTLTEIRMMRLNINISMFFNFILYNMNCLCIIALCVSKSDAFIALPGGLGTMEELTEILTWKKLQLHNKPVGLLNVAGYYDNFLKWVGDVQ